MHLEVVKSTHVATTSADTTDARDKALSQLAEVNYEIGLQDKQWLQTSQKNATTSSQPPEWKLNRPATIQWLRLGLPHCAAFDLHLQEYLSIV